MRRIHLKASILFLFILLLARITHAEFLPSSAKKYPLKYDQENFGFEKSFGVGDQTLVDDQIILTQITQTIKDEYINDLTSIGKKLFFQVKWDDDQARAYTTRDEADNPLIVVYGGMTRHPLMTPDAMMLILCHELGHYLGGAPKKLRGKGPKKSWSSVEGQADYFATAKCLKRVFQHADTFPSFSQNTITKSSEIKDDIDFCQDQICYRSAVATWQALQVFIDILSSSSKISFERKDPTKVSKTQALHPRPQCRLDTLIAGLRCPKSPFNNFKNDSPLSHACNRLDSQSYPNFARPRCWYSPE